MKKNLFLTGPLGVGKTTLLRKVLGYEALSYAGGFVTERAEDEDGLLLGYDLFPGAAAADFRLYPGWRFLDLSGPTAVHDNELFREKAIELLEQAEYYPYAMIDEFGGYELLIPQFRGALANFLNLSIPIIGVLKDADSVKSDQELFGLGPRFVSTVNMVRRTLEKDAYTQIVEMHTRDDPRAEEILRQWVREYIRF